MTTAEDVERVRAEALRDAREVCDGALEYARGFWASCEARGQHDICWGRDYKGVTRRWATKKEREHAEH